MAGSPAAESIIGAKIKDGIAQGEAYAHMPHQYIIPGARAVYGSHVMSEVTKPGKPSIWLDVQATAKSMRRDVIRAVFFSNILRAAAPVNVTKIRALEGFNRYISKKIPELKHFHPVHFEDEVLALSDAQKQTFAYLLALLKIHGESDLNMSNIAMSGEHLVLFDTDRQGYYWDLTLKEIEDAIFVEQNDDGVEVDLAPDSADFPSSPQRPRRWLGMRGTDFIGVKPVYDMLPIISDLYRPVTTQNEGNRRAQFKAFVTTLIQGTPEWIGAIADTYVGQKIYKSFVHRLVSDHLKQLKQLKQKLMTSKVFRDDFMANFDEYRQHVIDTCQAYNATYSDKYQRSGLVFDIEKIEGQIAQLARECVEPAVDPAASFELTIQALHVTLAMGTDPSLPYVEAVNRKITSEMADDDWSLAALQKGLTLYNECRITHPSVLRNWQAYHQKLLDQSRRKLSSYEGYFLSLNRNLLPTDIKPLVEAYKRQQGLGELAVLSCDRDCAAQAGQIKKAVFNFEQIHVFKPLQKSLSNAVHLDSLVTSLKLMAALDLRLTATLTHDIEHYFEHLIHHIVTVHPHKVSERVNQALQALYFYEKVSLTSPVIEEAKFRLSALAKLLPCKGDYLFFGYTAESAKKLGKFPKTAAKAVNELCKPIRNQYGGVFNMTMTIALLVEPKVDKTRFDRRESTATAYRETSALSFAGGGGYGRFSASDSTTSELDV